MTKSYIIKRRSEKARDKLWDEICDYIVQMRNYPDNRADCCARVHNDIEEIVDKCEVRGK